MVTITIDIEKDEDSMEWRAEEGRISALGVQCAGIRVGFHMPILPSSWTRTTYSTPPFYISWGTFHLSMSPHWSHAYLHIAYSLLILPTYTMRVASLPHTTVCDFGRQLITYSSTHLSCVFHVAHLPWDRTCRNLLLGILARHYL